MTKRDSLAEAERLMLEMQRRLAKLRRDHQRLRKKVAARERKSKPSLCVELQ